MSPKKIGVSECIRKKLVDNIIYSSLKSLKSLRLVGIPQIGITQIMKYIFYRCTESKEWTDFFAIYIDFYEINYFRSEIADQLLRSGYKISGIEEMKFNEIINQAMIAIMNKTPEKKFVLIFNDFQKNLQASNNINKNTILTESNCNYIRSLSEMYPNLLFIINYTYPFDMLLGTDYYINNFTTIPVELLTRKEAETLIQRNRANSNLGYGHESLEEIYYYGGRHPQLLDKASETDYGDENEKKYFIEWIERRYIEIMKYIDKNETYQAIPELSTQDFLYQIASQKEGMLKNNFPMNKLAERYCYIKTNKGQDYWKLFCTHFSDFLINKVERTKNNNALMMTKYGYICL